MSQTGTDQVVTVYADYVCPFCYLGKRSLEAYLDGADDPPRIEWRPFDLRAGERDEDGTFDGGMPAGKDEAYFEQVRENVRNLADRYDAEMAREVATDVDSWNAHKLALHLREAGEREAIDRFQDAVYEALWVEERDVGDPEVLVELASEAGVPEQEAREALSDPDLDERLADEFDSARRRGVTGVPTFVYDEHAARGAVPPEQLERLVEG